MHQPTEWTQEELSTLSKKPKDPPEYQLPSTGQISREQRIEARSKARQRKAQRLSDMKKQKELQDELLTESSMDSLITNALKSQQ